jgi:hypothetical protein
MDIFSGTVVYHPWFSFIFFLSTMYGNTIIPAKKSISPFIPESDIFPCSREKTGRYRVKKGDIFPTS